MLWNPNIQMAFAEVKEALCQAPVLYTSNFHKTFRLHTDTSAVTLRVVLTRQVEGEEHLGAFTSHKLSRAETRYSTIDKECLAIKWGDELFVWEKLYCSYGPHAPVMIADN